MTPRDQAQMVEERELFELFERRRTDARAFREGVARRIELAKEREQAASDVESAKRPSSHSKWWRRAAAFLPPDLAALALSGGKGWSAALALPALVLASAFGAFWAGARSIRHSTRHAAPAPASWRAPGRDRARFANKELVAGGALQFALQFAVLAVMVSPFLVGGRHAVDLIVGVVLLSMLALTVSLRGLSKAGTLERGAVLSLAAGLLSTVFLTCFLWSRSMRLADGESHFGLDWGAAVILAGQVALLWTYRRTMPGGTWRALGALVLWVAIFSLFPPFTTRSSPAAVRDYVEGERLRAEEIGKWEEVSASVEALAAVGAPAPDLDRIRREVERAIEEGVDAHPWVWTAAARMHLVDDAHWKQLAERRMEAYRLEQLMKQDGPLRTPEYGEYVLPMLLATRELDDAQRGRLVRRVEASWPTDETARALGDVAQCVRWLELLGRGDLVDARRDEVRAILERHWVDDGGLFARLGGFTSDPTKFRTSFDGETALGVQLMERVGAPPGVDLGMLRGFLRAESSWGGTLLDGPAYLHAIERATLLRFERNLGLPERSWAAKLFAERVAISTLLIVLLCFLAVRSAPERPDPLSLAGEGAQP